MMTLAIIGAGQRGKDTYGEYLLSRRDEVKIVGVAEPIQERRNYMKEVHQIEEAYVFQSWQELLKLPKFCDAVLICTNDDLHYEPAKAGTRKRVSSFT